MQITMTDDRPNDAGKMMQLLDLELSEREFYFIGRIVAASLAQHDAVSGPEWQTSIETSFTANTLPH